MSLEFNLYSLIFVIFFEKLPYVSPLNVYIILREYLIRTNLTRERT